MKEKYANKCTYPPYRSSSSFCRFRDFVSTKTVRESESESIILVVSACVKPSKLSLSLVDVGLSSASNVNGGLLSIIGKLSWRSTSLKSLSVIARRITDDGVASGAFAELDFFDWCAIQTNQMTNFSKTN